MSKKNNAKVSKIKSTKINKQDFIESMNNNLSNDEQNINNNSQPSLNQDNSDVLIQENHQTINNENTNNIHQTQTLNQKNENINNEEIKEDKTSNNNQQEIIDKLLNQIKELNQKNINLFEENNKLKSALDEERKQLIVKLEEKSQMASKLIEQKKIDLEQEKQNEINNAKDKIYIDVIENFLNPIILFEQTIKNSSNNPVVQSYVQGYNMIASMFKDKLNNLNVEQIDVHIGDDFNENFMEAFDVEHIDGVLPNKVTKIVSEGYVYKKQKVIKFTSVVVSK